MTRSVDVRRSSSDDAFLEDDIAVKSFFTGLHNRKCRGGAFVEGEPLQALRVHRVVGWVDFEAPGAVDNLNQLSMSPHLVGIRPMIQDIPDVNWMLQDRFTPIFDAIRANDLVFDALTLPQHLSALRTLVSRHPSLRAVIDHGSKPLIADGIVDGWVEDLSLIHI